MGTKIKYTEKDYRDHLMAEKDDRCLCCEQKLSGYWTDFHGEMKCINCGFVYQTKSFSGFDKILESLGITSEQVKYPYSTEFQSLPLFKAYWADEQDMLPIGNYMGKPAWSSDQLTKHIVWLHENKVDLLPNYEDDYKWDTIAEIATETS